MKVRLVAAASAVVLGAGVMVACGNNSDGTPPPSSQTEDEVLREWSAQVVSPLTKFGEDLQKAADPTVDTPEELKSHCVILRDDVRELKKVKPYPYEPDAWNSALDHYEKGFDACTRDDFSTMNNEVTMGNADFQKVNDDLEKRSVNMGGSSPPALNQLT